MVTRINLVLVITASTLLLLTGCASHVKSIQSGDIIPSYPQPWANQIDQIFIEHPWYGGEYSHYGNDLRKQYYDKIMKALESAPTEVVIQFTAHPVSYVNMLAHQLVTHKFDENVDLIKETFRKGSKRIKFELSPFVVIGYHADGVNCGWEVYTYLDQIIKDPAQSVHASDLTYIREREWGGCPKDVANPVDFYLRLSESEFILDRLIAFESLEGYPDEAGKIVPVLIEFLNKPDVNVPDTGIQLEFFSQRETSARAIGKMKLNNEQVIQTLRYALSDPDINLQYFAASSLYQLGIEPESQVVFILNHFQTEDNPENIRALLECVQSIGKDAVGTTPRLIELSHNADKRIRKRAINAIESSAGFDTAVRVSRDNLDDPSADVRKDSFYFLANNSAKNGVIDAIRAALKIKDPNIKFLACQLLLRKGAADDEIIKAMIEIALSDEFVSDAYEYLRIADDIGPRMKDAVPGLLKKLDNPKFQDLDAVIFTIKKIGGKEEDIVKRLIELVESDDAHIAYDAIGELGNLEGKAKDSIPVIYKILRRKYKTRANWTTNDVHNLDNVSKDSLIKILRAIPQTDPVPESFLLELMESPENEIASFAVAKAIDQGMKPDTVAKNLVEIINKHEMDISSKALQELGKFGKSSLPYLVQFRYSLKTNSERENYERILKNVIYSIGTDDKEMVKYLLPFVGCGSNSSCGEEIAKLAANKIFEITGDSDLIVKALIDVIKTRGGDSFYIVERLADFGEKAVPALPVIYDTYKTKCASISYELIKIFSSLRSGSDVTQDILLKYLDFPCSDIAQSSLDAFIRIGGSYDKLSLRLLEIVKKGDHEQTHNALFFLIRLKGNARAALPGLKKLPKYGDKFIDSLIESAIRSIENADSEN